MAYSYTQTGLKSIFTKFSDPISNRRMSRQRQLHLFQLQQLQVFTGK